MVDYLKNVIGHEKEKKEINCVIDWFKRFKELKSQGLTIPKGILLYGAPGNGKTYIIKNIIKNIDVPVLFYDDERQDVTNSLIDLFSKAKEYDQAIIIIDELDLLIDKNFQACRVLQNCIDGLSDNDNFLVITATNALSTIPHPLLRCGRIDKKIEIPYLTKDEAIDVFNYYINECGIHLAEELDRDFLKNALENISCSGIKSIVNDIALRNGKDNVTEDMVYESIYNITDFQKDNEYKKEKYIAYHEAGHAVMANMYKQYTSVKSLSMNINGGQCYCNKSESNIDTYEKLLSRLYVSLAGHIATKLIFKTSDYGVFSDLEQARNIAVSLINYSGYKGVCYTMPSPQRQRAETSNKKKYMNEKLQMKILKKAEKHVTKVLKPQIDKIKLLGDALYEKGHLNIKEISSYLNA